MVQSCGEPSFSVRDMAPTSGEENIVYPKAFTWLVEQLGVDRALSLSDAFGGLKLRIPRSEKSKVFAEISEAIGVEGCRILMESSRGEDIYIPNLQTVRVRERNKAIRLRFDELTGAVPGEDAPVSGRAAVDLLAREFYLSGRQIEVIVNS